MVKRVLVSAGPIPAKLDSVKVLTNKFKGGLALWTAKLLAESRDFDVHVVASRMTEVTGFSTSRTHYVSDIEEYMSFVKGFKADAYVLAAAVANIMPVSPWEGKFPSHEYSEGEEFNIRFKIAPRIIDRVREWHPKSVLVGYKLFDGPPDELVKAGRRVLADSRANLVFCNTPEYASVEKIVVTPEGGAFPVGFDEHAELLYRVISSSWFSTKTEEMKIRGEDIPDGVLDILWRVVNGKGHGTFAINVDGCMLTTKRRKSKGNLYEALCVVKDVDLSTRTIVAHEKATMNAPTLWEVLRRREHAGGILIHGHQDIGCQQIPYVPPGTIEEVNSVAEAMGTQREVYVQGHGFYKWFFTMDSAMKFAHGLGGS